MPNVFGNCGAGPTILNVFRSKTSKDPERRLFKKAKSTPKFFVLMDSQVNKALTRPGADAEFGRALLISQAPLAVPVGCVT
ncbi:hypothetical protein D3C81_2101220 [compost metagenome]